MIDIDMNLYDGALPERTKYEALKAESGDEWQTDTVKSKHLQSSLLKRAIYVLEKDLRINEASEKLKDLFSTQMLPKQWMDKEERKSKKDLESRGRLSF